MTGTTRRWTDARRLLAGGWRNVRAAGPRRLLLTAALLLLALLLARYSWQLPGPVGQSERAIPVVADAERSLYDLRAYVTARRIDQDQRIQIVVYDDETLIAARKRSPLDRGLLAKALTNLDAMGAKAIGVDILFDQPQDEDDALVAALRAMKTPIFIGYTDRESTADDIVFRQQQYLDGFVARLIGSQAKPASIRLDYAHGTARRWPEALVTLPPLLGRAMVGGAEAEAFARYKGAIRYRLPKEEDRPEFSSLRIDLFADPAIAAALAPQIRGRYVLVGGDIVDVDRVATPFSGFTGQSPPGIQVHAAMIAQMLDHAKPLVFPAWKLWLLAAGAVLAAALSALLEPDIRRALPLLLTQLLVIGGTPFLLQDHGVDTLGLPAVGIALGWILAFMAVSSAARASGAVERRFAQAALGRYLPPDIAQEIIDYPERLALRGTKANLFILFSDLEGFTQLSHELEPEVVARVLNDYLDRLSQVVLDHGGLIDKYVGDAVVAFWGAPIARADDGERAARAGYALWQAGEVFRREVQAGAPIGRTRVGLHYGEAVVGNFGGERRIQYTALGAAMNTAARLEAANKPLQSSVMASREFVLRSGLDWWRPMGSVLLRGRAQPVDLFEPVPDFPAADRETLAKAMALIDKDRDTAIALIGEVAGRHPADTALRNLLMRIRNPGKDGSYDLG
jgi:adenylate cyclase